MGTPYVSENVLRHQAQLAQEQMQRQLRQRRRRLHAVLALVVGLVLLVVAGTAYAAIILRGTGTVTAAAYQEKALVVSGERLSAPLTPGSAADLVFTVRNPNSFPVVVDRIALASGLRKVDPAGCDSKLAGPLMKEDGHRLPAAHQVSVPGGARQTVTVPAAVRLSTTARTGCGFVVDITVQGTQVQVTAAPDVEPSEPPLPQKPVVTSPAPQPTTPPKLGDELDDPADQ